MAIQVEIVTPTRTAFTAIASEVRAPGFYGQFCVLPDHAQLLSVVRPGVVHVTTAEGTHSFVVGKGFVEAGPDRIVLLIDAFEEAGDVDKAGATRLLEQSESTMANADPESGDFAVAVYNADLARARLNL